MKLYYFPVHAQVCDTAPLRFAPPDADWQEFSEAVARKYPKCRFFIDIVSEAEKQRAYADLEAQLQEFLISPQ